MIEAKDIEEQIIEAPKCCGNPMTRFSIYGLIDKSSGFQYICKSCGAYIKVEDGSYDEEVVEEYFENEEAK